MQRCATVPARERAGPPEEFAAAAGACRLPRRARGKSRLVGGRAGLYRGALLNPGFYPCQRRNVPREVAFLAKRLAALVAHVGALAGVNRRNVLREDKLVAKSLAALVAHVGALAVVHCRDVLREAALLAKRLAALVAWGRSPACTAAMCALSLLGAGAK